MLATYTKQRHSTAREVEPSRNSGLATRARRLMKQEIAFIPNPAFAAMAAESDDAFLLQSQSPHSESASTADSRREPLPRDYLRVGRADLLTPTQERGLFCRMNFLKYRANSLRAAIDPRHPDEDRLNLIENLLAASRKSRDEIVEANLRLVLSIVKQFAEGKHCFDELVSEGLHTLLRAVEKFDFDRGYRLSTYATHAIRRNLYRMLMLRKKEREHFEGEAAEHVADRTDEREAPAIVEARWEKLRGDWRGLMHRLDRRERVVIRARFGLGRESEPQTLQSLANDLGVCKERVRQLEKRALEKLRKMADELRIEDPQA